MAMSEAQYSSRRVYAKGFYDGLKLAGIEGGNMNAGRHKSVINNLTGVARKVFDAVPIKESWTKAQIAAEIRRISGAGVDTKVIDGCLNTLTGTGVIKEVVRGVFQRVDVTQNKEKKADVIEAVKCEAVSPAQCEAVRQSPIVILEHIANKMRAFSALAADLVQNIEDAAIEIEQLLDESEGKNEKLKQLQQLLKSLSLG